VVFPLKPFNRFALRNLSRAIGVSPAVGERLQDIFPKNKVSVIPNGIEMTSRTDAKREEMRRSFREFHGISHDALLVGTVGQLIQLKGQRDLVLAAAEVVKEVPQAQFVIVGQDNTAEKKFRRELKRLAKVLEIEDRILWLDWADDLPALFAALDLYVSPSHSESFGIATLEAMAAGLPVVATRTDGSRELLKSKELLVPFGDPVKLGKRITEVLKSEEIRKALSEELRRRAHENYSLDKMVDRIENLYLDILKTE
jgi:glycosyltransferase involved in cell wall biosynthesis